MLHLLIFGYAHSYSEEGCTDIVTILSYIISHETSGLCLEVYETMGFHEACSGACALQLPAVKQHERATQRYRLFIISVLLCVIVNVTGSHLVLSPKAIHRKQLIVLRILTKNNCFILSFFTPLLIC